MRLWGHIPPVILAAVGYFTYGWAAQAGDHWIAIAIALCCMITQQVASTSIATAYAMECFDRVSHPSVFRDYPNSTFSTQTN